MSRMKYIFFALLLFILVAFQNCGPNFQLQKLFSVNGTEIGNPGPTNPEPSMGTSGTLQIRSYTCALLVRCRPALELQECHDRIAQTNGIGEALGLPANRYDPFSSLEVAENSGTVVFDSQALERCNQELIQIPCNDARIDQAYNQTNIAAPLENISVIYPQTAGNCPNVFRETRAGEPVSP